MSHVSRRVMAARRRAESGVADFGTLNAQAAEDIAVMQEFLSNRDRIMSSLFGRSLRRNPTRDELLRQIMLQFAQGNRRRIAFYVRACSFQATAPSVRSELDLLVHTDLVELMDEPSDRRATLVAPTTKLVSFYNEQMPRLRNEVLHLLDAAPSIHSADHC